MKSDPHRYSIPLKKTWYEISDYLARTPRALNILHIINSVPPRSWKFTFAFDSSNRTLVTIQTDPQLEESELFVIADGTIPELFFVDELGLRTSGRALVARPRSLLANPPPTNLLDTEITPASSAVEGLLLVGYFGSKLPVRVQDLRAVRAELLERTWFGGARFTRRGYTLDWNVLGQKCSFSPEDRFARHLGEDLIFRQDFSLTDTQGVHLGEVRIGASEKVDENRSYHSRLGAFDAAEIDGDFWQFGAGTDDNWIVEVDEPHLHSAPTGQLAPFHVARDLLLSIRAEAWKRIASEEFQNYTAAKKERKLAQAAAALAKRQDRARRAYRVFFRGADVICVPSCENEVVALLCKIEGLKALPFHYFRLLEYTPSRGIDALADFQIEPKGARIHLGAVEFEHYFENFFDHDHPVEQVSLVVCWDFRDGEPPPGLPLVKKSNWLYSHSRGGYSFWILLLSRIPGIKIEEEEAT